MKHISKILTGLLTATMILSSSLQVAAQELIVSMEPISKSTLKINDRSFICSFDNFNEIQPYLEYLNTVFCDIQYNGGQISMQANCHSFKDNPISLSIFLERSNNGSTWTTVTQRSKFFNSGKGVHVTPGVYTTSTPGYYRVRAVALVYNNLSQTSILENVTIYSRQIQI